MQKKKLQKSILITEEEVDDDDIQDKITNLQSKKTNLIEDLQ